MTLQCNVLVQSFVHEIINRLYLYISAIIFHLIRILEHPASKIPVLEVQNPTVAIQSKDGNRLREMDHQDLRRIYL